MSISSKIMEDTNNFLLWNKIKDFKFDLPGTTVMFAHKLARQNNWTPYFTEKVIEEYKKFIFLCCISSSGASPSHAVDVAWHLHLTYTQSYWQDLCKNILAKELHHYPSKGGPEEKLKHEKWYKETLLLYEETFAVAPDPDIWPHPKEPGNEIEEVNFSPAQQRSQWLFFSFFLIFISISSGLVFPFSLTGTQFTIVYFFYGIFVFVKTRSFLNEWKEDIRCFIHTNFPGNATPLELVVHHFGIDHAIATSIVHLVNKKLLKVEEDKTFMVPYPHLVASQTSINSKQVSKLRQGTKLSYEELVEKLYKKVDFRNAVLQKMMAVVDSAKRPVSMLVWWYFLIGVVRLFRDLAMNQPVGYLGFEIFLFSILFLFLHLYQLPIDIYYNEIANLSRQKLESFDQPDNKLLADFAIQGSAAITSLPGGAILTSLFITHTSFIKPDEDEVQEKQSSCNSCGGCGG